MSESSFLGILVVTVWSHEGSSVARMRGYRSFDGPPEELGAAGGDEAIIEKVAAWLRAIAPHEGTAPGETGR